VGVVAVTATWIAPAWVTEDGFLGKVFFAIKTGDRSVSPYFVFFTHDFDLLRSID
jgi:hypothetical protein